MYHSPRRGLLEILALALFVVLSPPVVLLAQTPDYSVDARVPGLRVTDARLAAALKRLVVGSPRAAGVLDALASSGLPVAIGTPEQLASLPDSEGGPGVTEQRALLAESGTEDRQAEPPIAWVVFRVAAPAAAAPAGASDRVERVWVVVAADSVEQWIRGAGWADASDRIQDDFLAILAHEFVAHVGSIARTGRLDDFCDDPPPGQSTADGRAQAGGLACSIRVENQVRRELNRGLGLTGSHRLPERRSYALDVMNFARAYRKR